MLRLIRILFLALSLSACSTALKIEPVAVQYKAPNLAYFVENHGKDKRHLEQVIAAELKKRGLNATSGFHDQRPAKFDILVLYEDRWQWDMTNYLIHLRIDLRAPVTNVLLGSGSSYQTSLARESEDEVVRDIISGMFDDKPDSR